MKPSCKFCNLFERCPCGCAWGICSDIELMVEEDDGDGCESFEPNREWFETLEFLESEHADQMRDRFYETRGE